jgi:hypothetical protein
MSKLTTDTVADALSAAMPYHPIVAYPDCDFVEVAALGPRFAVIAVVFPETDTVGLSLIRGTQVTVHGADWALADAVAETVQLIGGVETIAAFVPRAVA